MRLKVWQVVLGAAALLLIGGFLNPWQYIAAMMSPKGEGK